MDCKSMSATFPPSSLQLHLNLRLLCAFVCVGVYVFVLFMTQQDDTCFTVFISISFSFMQRLG